MNTTRKQIIELIEPYMEKSPTIWCLIRTKYWKPWDDTMNDDMTPTDWFYSSLQTNRKFESIWTIDFKDINWDYWELDDFIKTYKDTYNTNSYWNKYLYLEYEILWHYDITAVLKYISKKVYTISVDIDWRMYIYKNIEDLVEQQWIWVLEDKPLHLYSEQEEKDLLDLLKIIWKQ